MAVQVAAVAGRALGPGIVLHELLRVTEPRGEPLDRVRLGEHLRLEPLEPLALDPRRGALEIVRVLAVELDERGAVLERFLLGGDLAQQVGHADLDPAVAADVQLERKFWGSWMPHKFKMAVSGCPRNCAEATIKDFGVICVDSGYELHIGGNGGIKVRVTDLLCKVATEQEAIHAAAAFVQLYREEARYLERTAPWIERVGLDYVKARVVVDTETRDALAERFWFSQRFFQDDPWAERAEGADRDLHRPLGEMRPLPQHHLLEGAIA